MSLLADTVISRRKALKMTQTDLAKKAGMKRSMLSKLETQDYTPSIDQLQALAECLGFEPTELFIDSETHPFSAQYAKAASRGASATGSAANTASRSAATTGNAANATAATTTGTAATAEGPSNIAIAGTGYVGLSLSVLLSQHNNVTAVDIIPEKIEKINNFESPIKDDYIEKFMREAKKGTHKLNLHATTDGASAYKNADFVIVSAPTNMFTVIGTYPIEPNYS